MITRTERFLLTQIRERANFSISCLIKMSGKKGEVTHQRWKSRLKEEKRNILNLWRLGGCQSESDVPLSRKRCWRENDRLLCTGCERSIWKCGQFKLIIHPSCSQRSGPREGVPRCKYANRSLGNNFALEPRNIFVLLHPEMTRWQFFVESLMWDVELLSVRPKMTHL